MIGGSLNSYLQRTQRMMRDQSMKLFNPADLIEYINIARRQIAMQAQCIRVVPPTSGQIISITVTSGGSGYTSPTVNITGPDSPTGAQLYPMGAQATASATVVDGVITAINVEFGGDGYFQPTITITDAHGTGATATAILSPINITVQGQEIYPFSQIPLGNFPGVDSILNVRSISVIFANWRYSCLRYPFQMYQSAIRRYPQNYQYVPEVCSQVGQGTSGTMFAYPIANAPYQWEWDCICAPADLVSNDSPEAIPYPWTDAVPFLAAHLCLLELGNFNGARAMLEYFDNFMSRYSAAARPGGVAVNSYGRV